MIRKNNCLLKELKSYFLSIANKGAFKGTILS
jgi:hypothetical protein